MGCPATRPTPTWASRLHINCLAIITQIAEDPYPRETSAMAWNIHTSNVAVRSQEWGECGGYRFFLSFF